MMTIGKSPILPCHHVVFFLLLVLQVTGQTTGQYPDQRPSQMNAVLIGMFMFMFFLTLVACGICCKYRGTAPETSSDIEDGGVVRTRRTSRGLEKDVIQSFPSFIYSQVKGLKIGKGGVECAICLNEFEDEEKIRLMPPCNHVFHADCIDVWLSSRSTCPVCRASLSPKPGSNQSLLYPFIRPHDHDNQDLETGNSGRSVLESADIRLLDGLTRSNNNVAKRPPRSRSTGTSNWRITELLFPRSHSTGHSLVPRGENLDRFTLHLPEEVRRQLSHMTTLPQARSSRQGYRSQSVGSERRGFRSLAPRTITLSFSFSFQNAYFQSTKGKEEKEIGEGSLECLRPEMVQSLH